MPLNPKFTITPKINSVMHNKIDMTSWLEYFVEGLRSQMTEIQQKGMKIIVAEKVVKMLQDFELNTRQE